MTISALAGPLVAFGAETAVPGQEYNPEQGPSLFISGAGLLDPRAPFNYTPGQNLGNLTAGFLDSFSSAVVNYVPSQLQTANIAALANVVANVPMTLVSSSGSGITVGMSIVNTATNVQTASNLLGIDIATASAASSTISGTTMTVGATPTTPFQIGMTVTGTGVSAGTFITGYGTGGGYQGTYTVNISQTVSSTTLTGTFLYNYGSPAAGVGGVSYQAIPFGQSQTIQIWNPAGLISRGVSITGVASGTGGNFLVSGYDVYGYPMTQTITVGAGVNTVNSTKAFKWIASVTPLFTDAHNYSVGTSDVYGFPLRSDTFYTGGFGDTQIWWNGAQITATTGYTAAVVTSPATSTTGDVRGTYAVQSASDGTKRLFITQNPSIPNSGSVTGLFGVTQA